jgi:3D (Asp-Asp-Asp) domain-containing protein
MVKAVEISVENSGQSQPLDRSLGACIRALVFLQLRPPAPLPVVPIPERRYESNSSLANRMEWGILETLAAAHPPKREGRGNPILRIRFAILIAFALLTAASASPPSSGMRRRPTIRYFIATAYSVEGTGAAGKWSHPGTVAADRKVLPLNSRIRIYGAGRYSGDYTVEDTGGKVDGHHIDVYMPSQAAAKKFGLQRVKVVVLKYGDDEASPPDPQQKAEAEAANRKERAKPNAAPTK